MILGIHHSCISTGNLERLRTFYCDLFGMKEVMRFGWQQGNEMCDSIVGLKDSETEFVYLRAGNSLIELFEYTSPEPKPRDPEWRVCDHGITHICFEVVDIQAEFDRLTALGMKFRSPAPIDADGMLKVIYGLDPDGNIVELLEFPDRDDKDNTASLTGAPQFVELRT
jgi:catechol 2,3-dioxygenase-like lactoylglutathione lyase family enzyme